MHCMTRAFTLPSGRRLPEARLIAIGVKQVVHAAALYSTPVVDVDYEALDHIVFPAVRRLLGLPRDASSAFLWTELTLWPSHLLAQKRTLHFAAEFTDTWFYREVVRRFRVTFTYFATSSLRRMMDTLQLFGKTLDDLQAPELVGDGDIDPKTLWKEHVRLVAWEKGFLPLLRRKMASYPAPGNMPTTAASCFPPDTEPASASPPTSAWLAFTLPLGSASSSTASVPYGGRSDLHASGAKPLTPNAASTSPPAPPSPALWASSSAHAWHFFTLSPRAALFQRTPRQALFQNQTAFRP